MNWAVWLILLIPVAVSILSLLFKSKEEPKRDGRLRPPPTARPGGPTRPGRRPVSDIDQFLEEINRRRREAAERRRPTEPTAAPTPPPIVERPAPPPPIPQREPLRPVPVPPPRLPRRPERERPLPTRIRERPLQPEPVLVAEPVPPPPPPAPPAPPAPAVPAVLGTYVVTRPPSPALTQLVTMLRSPQSLRTAILLREIFDPPVSRRAGQGPYFRIPGAK
jgi:hypothetical protein